MEPTLNPAIDSLNTRFAIPGRLHFADSGAGLPVAEISTPDAVARVALQGGQVLGWQPTGQTPVIWVSKAAVFQPGKGVRGGVPVCWPWFGAREGQGAHGFVRTRLWAMRETSVDSEGAVVMRLGIQDDTATRALWDYAFDLELRVTVGVTLKMELHTHNTGDQPFSLTEALHTYFGIGDIHQATVQGLDGTEYQDKVSPYGTVCQVGAVRFVGETDRVYLSTTADCLIEDPVLRRSIRVAKVGSTATVVWNPWTEKEKTFADMAPGEYRDMVCVESVNASPDLITVAPGGRHALVAVIGVEACLA
jgi:glucose-6-phosphate 1-epimerase